MSRRADFCLLLHMHQPQYENPETGRAELPWVRLHGARAYLDVASLLAEYEEMKLTVNFVPSLVAQLEHVVGGARDRWLEVALKSEGDWTPEERHFLLRSHFSLHWSRQVDVRPRYRDLLDKRGRQPSNAEDATRVALFSDRELRDLTVLFNLAWIGFAARKNDHDLEALENRGADYTLEDLHLVAERQRAACARVFELYRKLAERQQIELSASPFYHPIIPLLVSSDQARRSQPNAELPLFSYPSDADAQIAKGRDAHARAFGAAPRGMWPPEGSVSPEAVAAYARANIGWLATDEGNLWRSLQMSERPAAPGDLYRSYRYADVDLLFRDRELSDRIGFVYAHTDAESAALDLIDSACARVETSTAPSQEPALVPIFLDGENPWESYAGAGEPFLRALFAQLCAHDSLRPQTISGHLGSTTRVDLAALHSGSWIDSDFHIWIGDPVKNCAWRALSRARRTFAEATRQAPNDAAFEHLLAAEGSDWFWWFGEPFHSAEDALFDQLFRAHLQSAYRALGVEPPTALEQSILSQAGQPSTERAGQPPRGPIQPRIAADAQDSFYDWVGAGIFEIARGAAMADHPFIERIHYGWDSDRLYFRFDPEPSRNAEFLSLQFHIDLSIADVDHRVITDHEQWRLGDQQGPVASRRYTALALPLSALNLTAGGTVALGLSILREDRVVARYPSDGAFTISVPAERLTPSEWLV